MKFQIMGRDGKEKLRTFDDNLIPDTATMMRLESEGYYFMVKGIKTSAIEVDKLLKRDIAKIAHRKVKSIRNPNYDSNDGCIVDISYPGTKYTQTIRKQFDTIHEGKKYADKRREITKPEFWGGATVSTLDGSVVYTI